MVNGPPFANTDRSRHASRTMDVHGAADPYVLLNTGSEEWLAMVQVIEYIEHHLHNRERWLGAKAGWNGLSEVDEADPNSLADFRLDAGNDTWGTALCLLGSGDTPVLAGKTLFDFHRICITSAERTTKYRFRIAWGASYAAAIAAGTYTEIDWVPQSAGQDSGPTDMICPKINAGTKVFGAVWCNGQNTGWIDFTLGLHEYD